MKNIALLFLFVSLLTGCGGKNIPISGTVTFSDDGTPVPVGIVVFDDGTSQARGRIQPNGRYVMSFLQEGDGVPLGEYGVAVTGAVQVLPNPENIYPTPVVELIDKKYADKKTSELTFKVDGSQRIYNIKVDRRKM
jgi:hypothetical protein